MIALALLLQAAGPTVGDTVWLSRTVVVPEGRSVRAADWEPADPVELLGPARVIPRGGSVEIAYPVAIWRAGSHTLEPPGPLLLGADGSVDSLASSPVTVGVASVLPPVPPDSTLRPQPRAEFVPRGTVSIVPLVMLWGLAALLLAPLHWWWRRRGRPAAPTGAGLGPAPPPLEQWSDAGESRAVAAAATARLRDLLSRTVEGAHPVLDTETLLAYLAANRPDWPLAEIGDLLRSLDEARFGEATFPDAIGLARWALELEPRLRPEQGRAA